MREAHRRRSSVNAADVLTIVALIAIASACAAILGIFGDLAGLVPRPSPSEAIFDAALLLVPASTAVLLGRRCLQLAGELKRRQMAEEVLRKSLEETGLQRTRTLALLDSARSVLDHQAPRDAAATIFESCKCLIGAKAGYLLTLADGGQVEEILAFDAGPGAREGQVAQSTSLTGLSEQAFLTRKATYRNELKGSPKDPVLCDAGIKTESVLYAPLANGDRVVGLIALANKQGGFSAQDAEIAAGFGDLAAVALHNGSTIRALKRSEERFRSVAETATDAIVCTDSQGMVIFWNQQAEGLSGYSAAEMLGQPLATVIPDRFHADYLSALATTSTTRQIGLPTSTIERMVRRKDGSECPIELSLATWQTDEGLFVTLIVRDISERKRGEELLRTVANSSPIGIYVVEGGKFRFVNPQFQRFTGYSEEELLGTDSLRLVLPDDRERVRECAVQMLRGERSAPYEYRIVMRDGEIKWIIETVASIHYEGRLAAVGNFIDINERKELEDKLAYLATHDPLTGLPNRRSLEEAMDRVVARAKRGRPSTLLFLDVDDFKLINDTLGHAAGDRALARISGLLQDQLRAEDLLARLGGDEFAVLLEGVEDNNALAIAERMRSSIEASPLAIDTRVFRIGLSIGLVKVDGEQSPLVSLSRADSAMYEAKARGGNLIVADESHNGDSRGLA